MEYMRNKAIRNKNHEMITAKSELGVNSVELEIGASENQVHPFSALACQERKAKLSNHTKGWLV